MCHMFLHKFLNKGPINVKNLKYFIYLLLVIPAHTAGLERMFKGLKQMKSKARNCLSKSRTKKLIMIMNFIDEIEIDLNEIVKIYKTL